MLQDLNDCISEYLTGQSERQQEDLCRLLTLGKITPASQNMSQKRHGCRIQVMRHSIVPGVHHYRHLGTRI